MSKSPKHPRATTAALAVAVSLVFSGCASLSKEECVNAEWYTIGYEDGSRGIPRTRLGDHREACAEHGVQPRPQDYFHGHDDGLLRFCTPGNGYRTGAAGRNVSVSCPPHLAGPFNEAYRYGRRVNAAEQARARHSRAVDAKRAELAKASEARGEVEQRLVGNARADRQQMLRLEKTRGLFKREAELEIELAALERERGAGGGPAVHGRGNGRSKEHDRRGAAVGQVRNNAANGSSSHKQAGPAKGKGLNAGADESHAVGRGRDGHAPHERHGGGGQQGNGSSDSRKGNRGVGHGEPTTGKGKPVAVRTASDHNGPSFRGEHGPGRKGADQVVFRRKQKELEQVRREIRTLEQQDMRADAASHRERVRLLKQSKRLAREEQRLESELRNLERESERLKHEVDRLRAHSRWR